MQLSYVQR